MRRPRQIPALARLLTHRRSRLLGRSLFNFISMHRSPSHNLIINVMVVVTKASFISHLITAQARLIDQRGGKRRLVDQTEARRGGWCASPRFQRMSSRRVWAPRGSRSPPQG